MDILLVEDNADAALAVVMLLQMEGFQVRHATGVKSGVEAIAASVPSILVSDLRLRDGNGCDVARALPAGVPAIATSGLPREDAWPECRDAGFTRYLQKPVDFGLLVSTIRALLPTVPPAG